MRRFWLTQLSIQNLRCISCNTARKYERWIFHYCAFCEFHLITKNAEVLFRTVFEKHWKKKHSQIVAFSFASLSLFDIHLWCNAAHLRECDIEVLLAVVMKGISVTDVVIMSVATGLPVQKSVSAVTSLPVQKLIMHLSQLVSAIFECF